MASLCDGNGFCRGGSSQSSCGRIHNAGVWRQYSLATSTVPEDGRIQAATGLIPAHSIEDSERTLRSGNPRAFGSTERRNLYTEGCKILTLFAWIPRTLGKASSERFSIYTLDSKTDAQSDHLHL
jgi:hypothetical protein